MTKYFLDTTIIADSLLKGKAAAAVIRQKLSAGQSELPMFAMREFKAGPLRYWVYAHNKIATTKSFHRMLEAIYRLSRTPRRYLTSSSLQALQLAVSQSLANRSIAALSAKYGSKADLDVAVADEVRLQLYRTIMVAWKKRHQVATTSVCPLPCYSEADPYMKRGLIELDPTACVANPCCLTSLLRADQNSLSKLHVANQDMPVSAETTRRGRVLKDILTKKNHQLSERECSDLGDALFAFFAPQDAVILTTNTKDHEPLAAALGKSVDRP